jgi:hypothetical protein
VTQPLKNLLRDNQEFRALLNRAQTLKSLQQAFASAAPPQLAKYCQVLGLQFGTLSIAVGNATVAAKLRQLSPEIASNLRDLGCEVNGILVKVQVTFSPAPVQHTPRILSPSAQDSLRQLGASLTDDSPLKKALDKITRGKG